MSSSMLSINLLCIYILSGTVREQWRSDHTSSARLQVVKVGYRKWSFFFKALTGKIVAPDCGD